MTRLPALAASMLAATSFVIVSAPTASAVTHSVASTHGEDNAPSPRGEDNVPGARG